MVLQQGCPGCPQASHSDLPPIATQTLPAWHDVPQQVCPAVPHPASDGGVLEPSAPPLEVVEPEPEEDVLDPPPLDVVRPEPEEDMPEPSAPPLELVEPEPEPESDVEAELEPEPELLVDPLGAPPSRAD